MRQIDSYKISSEVFIISTLALNVVSFESIDISQFAVIQTIFG